MTDDDYGKLTAYYTDDHQRLDALLARYQQLKENDQFGAKKVLQLFRSGLEQHMAWEEAILFSEYDSKVREPGNNLTEQLLSEHGEILNMLDRLETKLSEPGSSIEAEEVRLLKALADHNRMEETSLYLPLDRRLTDQEREEIFVRMRESEWPKE